MNKVFAILFFTLMISACYKDVEIKTITGSPIPVSNVEASLIGVVFDDNNQPVSGATIIIRGQSLKTDAQGFFSLNDELLNENGVYISISKTGFYTTGKFVLPQLGNLSQMFFKLKRISSINFLSTEDFNLQKPNASIYIPSGSLSKLDAAGVSGFIQANVQFFSPLENLVCDAPGDLRGIDKAGKNKLILSKGIVYCSFFGGSSDPLIFKPGFGAKLRVAAGLPSQMGGNLDQEIPVWKFDPITGYWHESLKAQLASDKSAYEVVVPEMGYWNIGRSIDMIKIKGRLVDANGNGVNNLRMTITSTDKSFCTEIASDNGGNYSVFVPSGEDILVDLNSSCGNNFGQFNLGSFEASSTVPNNVIVQSKIGKLSGKLINCENLPVEGGIISIFQDTSWLGAGISDKEGNFSINLVACLSPTALNYRLLDPETKTYTPSNLLPLFSADMNLGTQLLCEKMDQFIRIQFGNESATLSNPSYMVNDFSSNQIEIQYPGGPDNFQLNAANGLGNIFTMQEIGISITSNSSIALLCSFCSGCECNSNDQLESFMIKGIDKFCTGRLTSFVGGSEQKTLSILYKVRRDK